MKLSVFWIVFVSLFAVGLGAGAAHADGLPVLGVDVGGAGVVSPSGDIRFVTVPAGRGTVVERVKSAGGQVVASRLLTWKFTIPAVAYDGSASGLSADGRTLVLIRPRLRFPRSRTALIVIDAASLRPRRVVELPGDFSFDAISPRGSLMYLIEYVSPQDPTRYLVRVFDLRVGRLLAAPVTDPHEPGDKMRGSPLTRLSSPGGRWAYTLYDGGGGTPFVHALDTSGRTARCIDLDSLVGRNLSRARLGFDETGSVVVSLARQPLVVIDTATFRPSAVIAGASAEGSTAMWRLVVLVGVAVLITSVGVGFWLVPLLRRRRLELAR